MRNVNVNVSPFVYINPSVDPCALMVKVIRIDIFQAPVKPPDALAISTECFIYLPKQVTLLKPFKNRKDHVLITG